MWAERERGGGGVRWVEMWWWRWDRGCLPLTAPPPLLCTSLSSQGQIKSLCNSHSHSIKSSPLQPWRNSCGDSVLSVPLGCCRGHCCSSAVKRFPPYPPSSHSSHIGHRVEDRERTAKIAKITSKCLHERRRLCFIFHLSLRHNKAQLPKKIAQCGQQARKGSE